MAKILFVAHVQSHIINFHLPYIKGFIDKGYEVHVATKMDDKKYFHINNEYPEIIWNDINIPRSPFSLHVILALKKLTNLMKSNKFNIIHVHTPVGAFLGRLSAKITKSGPVIYTAHGFHFFKGAPAYYWITYYLAEKIAARWTDGLITLNNEDYELSVKKLKVKNNKIFKVDGVGIDLEGFKFYIDKDKEFMQSLGIDNDYFIITVISELIKRKNHIQIIKAIESIISTKINVKIKVLFVGDGELEGHLKNEVQKRGLSENIVFLGYRMDVNKIINISDVIGLFSLHEGLPKNILEAMACGKPVICTDVRGNNDLIENDINGILVQVNNIKQTENAILKLMDKSFATKMGNSSLEKIKKYDIKEVFIAMNNIYNMYLNIDIENEQLIKS